MRAAIVIVLLVLAAPPGWASSTVSGVDPRGDELTWYVGAGGSGICHDSSVDVIAWSIRSDGDWLHVTMQVVDTRAMPTCGISFITRVDGPWAHTDSHWRVHLQDATRMHAFELDAYPADILSQQPIPMVVSGGLQSCYQLGFGNGGGIGYAAPVCTLIPRDNVVTWLVPTHGTYVDFNGHEGTFDDRGVTLDASGIETRSNIVKTPFTGDVVNVNDVATIPPFVV